MRSRQKIYNTMVNRQPGISYRYHKMHDGSVGIVKILSWVYLFWLNFCYYMLCCHFLGEKPGAEVYESKRLICDRSESADLVTHGNSDLIMDQYVDVLKDYDIVSFDIFDTLIFRPLSDPTDLFYFLGERLDIMNFKDIRKNLEWKARQEVYKQSGHYEVTLEQIWNQIEHEVGVSAKKGLQLEQSMELSLCYANPFMKEVFSRLREMGKQIIIVSDMYLSHDFLEKLLDKNGYGGFSKLYVSCEYGKNKGCGNLFEVVKKDFPTGTGIIHVGDNEQSDVRMAQKAGFATYHYPNVNKMSLSYRSYDMSAIIGGAYRGIVNNHIYCGVQSYSMEYEYGFIYGGLFVLGYCDFIHRYYTLHGLDKVLFLSRDGEILKQAYDFLYPEDHTAYVYWSRKAATKLMADEDRHDYFRRFIYHKVNQGYTIGDILHSMELDFLVEQLGDLRAEDELTDRNGQLLRRFVEAKWEQVILVYRSQMNAAGKYYKEVLQGCDRVAAVDIGWAGSGALALSHLTEKVWKIPCKITGIVAGTNTVHNAEPDASEPFLQSGKLVAYLYSQSHNRDLLKKHDPNKDYNVFWELLLSSPTPQFQGFSLHEDGKVKLDFGDYDENIEGIKEIQRGILDFVREYHVHFESFPYMFRISGRDAYAPMLVAASHDERYLREMEKRFSLEVNVG